MTATHPNLQEEDSGVWKAEEGALSDCDREPIHLPSSIQPHGVLFVLARDGRLLQSSANAEERLRCPPEAAAQRAYAQSKALEIRGGNFSGGRHTSELSIGGERFSLYTHPRDAMMVCELEPIDELGGAAGVTELNRLSSELSQVNTTQQAYQHAVTAVKALTGFDRVLGYAFGKGGHGTVVAESLAPGVYSLLGLRFPATDIPQQARRLYALELTRQIADVNEQAVPLQPRLNPTTGKPLNMSFCHLRSVSPVHVQYLKNMGVSASFSISMVVNGVLVGLVACHHYRPKHLSVQTRQVCEVVSRMISQNMATAEIKARSAARSRQLGAQVNFLCELEQDPSVTPAGHQAWARALPLVRAPSLLVKVGGEQAVVGDAPADAARIGALCERLAARDPGSIASTESLAELSRDPALGGGLLLVPLAGRGWLAWYRPPLEKVVHWAGAPATEEPKGLTPRTSFAKWQETVRGTCESWSESDLEMAEMLRRGLTARLGRAIAGGSPFERAMHQMREYAAHLEEHGRQLARANLELGQFAHVASHDLRAPLRTIRSFVPLLAENCRGLHEDAHQWLGFIGEAANTLHRLQEGLWSYAAVERQGQATQVDTHALLSSLVQGLAADFDGCEVVLGDLPTVEAVAPQVEALFRNLLDNASKYRDPNRRLKLIVDHHVDRGQHVFSVSDNGIGFPTSAEDRVFDLFSRLHPDRAGGDGLGLALCRRIVHHHHGWIRAQSEPGSGTTFEFCLQRAPQRANA